MNAAAFVCRVELHAFASRLAALHLCASGSLPFVFRAQDELRDLACLMLCLCVALSHSPSLCVYLSLDLPVSVFPTVYASGCLHRPMPVCLSVSAFTCASNSAYLCAFSRIPLKI